MDAAKAAAVGLIFDAVKPEDLVSEGRELIEYAKNRAIGKANANDCGRRWGSAAIR